MGAEGEFYKVGIGSSGCTDALILCVPYILHVYIIYCYMISTPLGRSRSWQPFFGACRTSRKSQEWSEWCLPSQKKHIDPNWLCENFLVPSIPQNYLSIVSWLVHLPPQTYPPQKYEEGLIRETNRTHWRWSVMISLICCSWTLCLDFIFKKWQEAHALLLCEETGPLPELAQILVSLMLGALGRTAMTMAR